jgi:hypothetical protein
MKSGGFAWIKPVGSLANASNTSAVGPGVSGIDQKPDGFCWLTNE